MRMRNSCRSENPQCFLDDQSENLSWREHLSWPGALQTRPRRCTTAFTFHRHIVAPLARKRLVRSTIIAGIIVPRLLVAKVHRYTARARHGMPSP